MTKEHIPNINIAQVYDTPYNNANIHYESLGNLASFFGRSMHLHRHDRYCQLHYIHNGKVHLILGDKEYTEQAPLLFFTPPAVPHGFIIEPTATGQVLTVSQTFIEQLVQSLNKCDLSFDIAPICITLNNLPPSIQNHYTQFQQALKGLRYEAKQQDSPSQSLALHNWTQLVLIYLFRLVGNTQQVAPSHSGQSYLFRKFLSLIEDYYTQNLPITYYAQLLNITEGRLNSICRNIAGASSKQLIYERLVQEAKYLLSYTSLSIKEISFSLGFKDPAYFSRFFTKYTKETPKKYRTPNVN